MAAAAKLALITALGIERQWFARGWPVASDSSGLLLHSGIGVAKARLGVEKAVAQGATSILLLGFAGGLATTAAPGTVLVPRQIRYRAKPIMVDADYHQRVCAGVNSLQPVTESLLCVDRPLLSVGAKAEHAVDGFACDMESAAITAAQQASIPAAVVKVVLDGAEDTVPQLALAFADANGDRRLPTIGAGALNLAQWWQLVRLLPAVRVARHQLRAVAEQLRVNAGNLG